MEKKVKSSDKEVTSKIIYAVVLAILCVTAIVVGIVSAASKNKGDDNIVNPPIVDNDNNNNDNENQTQPPEEEKKETFAMPIDGEIVSLHDTETPVFSTTLGEWRVHTGVDISAESGADVYASASGVVSAIFNDARYGYTVEIQHNNDLKTRYSNLSKDESNIHKVGDEVKKGDKIGTVGDTSLFELADEPHLHFEMVYQGKKVNPLDYIGTEGEK